ncbi:MAG: 2TM domain-containing protein [Desulfobacteraceae bacterium]|nr:2TM domain-containing protein [Desulfobacteraceae bacterium]
MENNKEFKKAKSRVEAKIGFGIHLTIYILVNTMLITTNSIHSREIAWSAGPLFGWGIGLFFHGLKVYMYSSLEQIKKRMIQKELAKDQA